MKILPILFITMSLVVGCATMGPVTPPEGCDGSLIYKLVPDPHTTDVLLRLANLGAIDNSIYTPDQAIKTINVLREYLDKPTTTYSLLASVVGEQVGPYFVLIGELVPQFSTYDIPISQCDKELFKAHLDRQEQIVRLRMF